MRGLEGRRVPVSREGGGGRVARGCFVGGDASTKATRGARDGRRARPWRWGAAPSTRSKRTIFSQGPEYSWMGGAKATQFSRAERHNASRGQTRRDGDDASSRSPRRSRRCLSPGRRGLRGTPRRSSPRSAGARGSTRGIPNRQPRVLHDTHFRRAARLTSPPDAPPFAGEADSDGTRPGRMALSAGPRFVSRARSRAPAGRRPRRRLARDPRDLAPKHEDIVRLARLLEFLPLAALDPLR